MEISNPEKEELKEMCSVLNGKIFENLLTDEHKLENILGEDLSESWIFPTLGSEEIVRKVRKLRNEMSGKCPHCGKLSNHCPDKETCLEELEALAIELGACAVILHESAHDVACQWYDEQQRNIDGGADNE